MNKNFQNCLNLKRKLIGTKYKEELSKMFAFEKHTKNLTESCALNSQCYLILHCFILRARGSVQLITLILAGTFGEFHI